MWGGGLEAPGSLADAAFTLAARASSSSSNSAPAARSRDSFVPDSVSTRSASIVGLCPRSAAAPGLYSASSCSTPAHASCSASAPSWPRRGSSSSRRRPATNESRSFSCWSMIFLLASAMATVATRRMWDVTRVAVLVYLQCVGSKFTASASSTAFTVDRLSVLPPSFRPTSATTAPAASLEIDLPM
eukprot:COSAG04_NODE_1088_length_8335_cov_16.006071_3_plen_187_part_00